MKVVVGSKNKTKVGAVEKVWKDVTITSLSVPSGVANQPFTDEETMQGAVNRAKRALQEGEAQIGIGLEGGVMKTEHGLFMCNWGALATSTGKTFVAGGARIKLPDDFLAPLEAGKELSEVMEEFVQRKDIRSHEGAIGIFTDDYVDRTELFVHVVKLLVGQYKYDEKQA
ncbi:inosine/xanthosine triphosphatase [Bacillus wiedmannii]|uniref:DUF84 family protein n=1 Tax=Bacillus wiedmannii TaxID=1890302 RepID=UPI000BEC0AE0|nr:DUF84 family protein [Bacillus wiedmannii]PEA74798.1 inosine/xanthosine triphosphatase [Bacillus wiedmannii]PEP74037.1 inosine/xanthosine triphosphatase [Bacillus wiedmannii]PGA36843.1 inosine/xanthosine triphosphatase [Bacillus wiedmannii]PGB91231.1 inosine/xanthosine triphosphatase [Bacillus wiedmannii]PHB90797.1 inosine/xanthosine triphosphatase [Bacillus wiedmannii]